jgi:hypothetical protein
LSAHVLKQVWGAISHLNPNEVRELAETPVIVGLHHRTDEVLDQMEAFFSPVELSRERRLEIFERLFRVGEPGAPTHFDIEIYEKGLPHPAHGFVFHPQNPEYVVTEILRRKEDLWVPLARQFPPFRKPVAEELIHKVSRENALFSLATALPDIMPSIMTLPWAVGQFASDTAFLTVNQVRLAFLLAGASDRLIGYNEQRSEVGSIIAGAFGWRAVARQLVGKIPLGGGLIPKAAIAYAGTFVAGSVLERLYREGYDLSRHERQAAYESAFDKGKRVAAELLETVKQRKPA